MRFFISILLLAVLSFAVESFFPWWTIAIICFLMGFLFLKKIGKSFLVGFLGIALMWLIVAYKQDVANDHILATRMAALFHLPNSMIFIVVASLIGGLVGGLSALTGAALRKNFS